MTYSSGKLFLIFVRHDNTEYRFSSQIQFRIDKFITLDFPPEDDFAEKKSHKTCSEKNVKICINRFEGVDYTGLL